MIQTSSAMIAFFTLLICTASLRADPATEPAVPLAKRLEEFSKIQQELIPLFAAKDWQKIAEACKKQIKLVPESGEPHYNLACALNRMGQKDAALVELAEAVEHGFTDSVHMQEDDDLTTLHDEARFKELVKKAYEKRINAPHEAGAEIPGVKMIEGFPEQGLRFRLRIDPAANAKKPARLLIWLHPSGGSMDNVVEQLSPQFAKDGFALLVFTQKNYLGWTGPDANAMMLKTVPAVAKIEGVDASKPVLLGFSAGGQLALQMWQQHPGSFGGMILDAAYPIDMQRLQQHQLAAMALPNNDAIQKCPTFVLVGADDGLAKVWPLVEKSWRDAKIPLTIHIIPGKGHTWLLDAAQSKSVHAWLKRVAAGEFPSEISAPSTKPAAPDDKIGPSIKAMHEGDSPAATIRA